VVGSTAIDGSDRCEPDPACTWARVSNDEAPRRAFRAQQIMAPGRGYR
jgi:hypothetical protein